MDTNEKMKNGDDGGKHPQPLPGEQKQTPDPEIPQLPNKEVEQMPVTPREPGEEQHEDTHEATEEKAA